MLGLVLRFTLNKAIAALTAIVALLTSVNTVSATATPTTITPGIAPCYSKYCRQLWVSKTQKAGKQVEAVKAYSPAMGREIPLVLVKAKNPNRPIIYLLNGADGGEGSANWVMQTNALEFYQDKDVNVVIPMAGMYSYYTDWVTEQPELGGKQMWETFLIKELPPVAEKYLHASNQRVLLTLSMSATSGLLYAEHNPGFYQVIGSFSGCAETNDGLGEFAVNTVLRQMYGNNIEQMWGPKNSPNRLYHDALINSDKLRGQTMYISTGTGWAGRDDVPVIVGPITGRPGDPTLDVGPYYATQSTIIESGTHLCTKMLKYKLDQAGIPATWNFRDGNHGWTYFQDDLYKSWDLITKTLKF